MKEAVVSRRDFEVTRAIVMVLVALSGSAAVLMGVYVYHQRDPFWGLLGVVALLGELVTAPLQPRVRIAACGGVAIIACLVLAGVTYYLKNPNTLWGFIVIIFIIAGLK